MRVESWNGPAGPSHWNHSAVSSCSKSSCDLVAAGDSGARRFEVHGPAEPGRKGGVVAAIRPSGQRDRDVDRRAGRRGRVQQPRLAPAGQDESGGVVDDAEAAVALDPLLA